MQQRAIMCVLCSAAIVCLLGVAYWVLTFYSDKFQPRDQSLLLHLQRESPQLTRQTSMWRAWIGFNASHSLGAIFSD